MNVGMFVAPVLLQSNDRSCLCPLSSLFPCRFVHRSVKNSVLFKGTFLALFFTVRLLFLFPSMSLSAYHLHFHKLALIVVPYMIRLPELV